MRIFIQQHGDDTIALGYFGNYTLNCEAVNTGSDELDSLVLQYALIAEYEHYCIEEGEPEDLLYGVTGHDYSAYNIEDMPF